MFVERQVTEGQADPEKYVPIKQYYKDLSSLSKQKKPEDSTFKFDQIRQASKFGQGSTGTPQENKSKEIHKN